MVAPGTPAGRCAAGAVVGTLGARGLCFRNENATGNPSPWASSSSNSSRHPLEDALPMSANCSKRESLNVRFAVRSIQVFKHCNGVSA